MKGAKNKNKVVCDTCIHHFVIAGCDCCGKPNADWDVDTNGNFYCSDYVKKVEVKYEKEDSNA